MPLIYDDQTTPEPLRGWSSSGVDLTPQPAPGPLTPSSLAGMLESRGWSRNAAYGIAANAAHESGGSASDPGATLNPGAIGDGGTSSGLLQWHGPRQKALHDFATSSGRDWRDPETQLSFFESEISPDLRRRLNESATAGDAGALFSREFERPAGGDGEAAARGKTAESLLAKLGEQASTRGPLDKAISVASAAFRQQNSIGSALALHDATSGPYDPTFDPIAAADADATLRPYLGSFVDVRNAQGFAIRAAQVRQELADRKSLDDAGVFGTVAAIAAGALDPVNLIPVGGGVWKAATLGRAIARGAIGGAIGGATSEAALQATQQTRTLEESARTVGTAAVLGGVLGGAVRLLGKPGLNDIAGRVDHETGQPVTTAVRDALVSAGHSTAEADAAIRAVARGEPPPEAMSALFSADTEAKSLSAAVADRGIENPYAIARGLEGPAHLLADTPLLSSPDLVLATSPVQEAREAMRALVRPALATEADVAGIPAGENVEASAGQWHGALYGATKQVRDVYSTYRSAASKAGEEAIDYRGFAQMVAAAGRRGDSSEALGLGQAGKAAVDRAASIYRRDVWDPLRDEAVRQGVLTQGAIDKAEKFADSYVPRSWIIPKIVEQRTRFTKEVVMPSIYRDWTDAKANIAHSAEVSRYAEEQLRQIEAAGRELGGPDAAALIAEGKPRPPAQIIRDTTDAIEKSFQDPSVKWEPDDAARARALISKSKTPVFARDGIEGVRKGVALTDAEIQELQDLTLRTLGTLPGDAADLGVRAQRAVAQMRDHASTLRSSSEVAARQEVPFSAESQDEKALGQKSKTLDARSRQAARDVAALDRALKRVVGRIEKFTAGPAPDEFISLLKTARQRPPAEPESLFTFIRRQGGLLDDGGELSSRDLHGTGGLTRKAGLHLDDMALRAQEAGFLPRVSDDVRAGIDDLLAAIDAEAAGRKQFRVDDEWRLEARDVHSGALDRLDEMGLSRDDIARLTDDELYAKTQGKKPPPRSPQRLSELRMEERRLGTEQQKMRATADILSGDAAVAADERSIARSIREGKAAEARAIIQKQAADLADRAAALEAQVRDYEAALNKSLAQRAKAARMLTAEDHLGRLDEADLPGVASDIVDGLIGHTNNRIQYEGIAIKERGPMKEKTFNVRDTDVEEWIDNDVEGLAQRYVQTMAADVEMKRLTGSVNGDEMRQRIVDGYTERANAMPDGPAKTKLDKRLKRDLEAFDGIVGRLRGQYGLPRNAAEVWTLRAGRVLKAVTFVSKLGWGPIGQLSDTSRIVFTDGLQRFVGDAFVPMVSNWQGVKLTRDELRLANIATEVARGSMALRGAEIFDDYAPASAFERLTQKAATGASQVFLLDHWNAMNKTIAGLIGQAKLVRAVRSLAAGDGRLSAQVVSDLSRYGIGQYEATRLLPFLEDFGRDVKGLYIPNTIEWSGEGSRDAIRLWRGALRQAVDDAVINPGQDRGLWMSRPLGSILGQLETFNLVSTQRTILAGMQRRDAAVAIGSAAMAAAGTFQFWLKSQIAGWDMPQNPLQWLQAGVQQSGLLGAISSIEQRVAAATRGAVGFDALTGSPARSRYAAAGPLSALGPNAGLAEIAWTSLQNSAAGDWNWKDTHRLRSVIPLNNLAYLRFAFDRGEQGLNDALGIPNKRQR